MRKDPWFFSPGAQEKSQTAYQYLKLTVTRGAATCEREGDSGDGESER